MTIRSLLLRWVLPLLVVLAALLLAFGGASAQGRPLSQDDGPRNPWGHTQPLGSGLAN